MVGCDLAIAVAIARAARLALHIPPQTCTRFYGQLGIDGKLRATPGARQATSTSALCRDDGIIVAAEDLSDTRDIAGIAVHPAADLREALRQLRFPATPSASATTSRDALPGPGLRDLLGLAAARHAFEVAAADGHHMIMLGAPDSGAVMLAERLPRILPPRPNTRPTRSPTFDPWPDNRTRTRHNHRGLRLDRSKDFVRNSDIWTVARHYRDGSLSLRHHEHRGTVRIPANYVAEYVELAYATTATRIQGATVGTAHALVTDDMAREHLYVAASRAHNTTSLYAVTHVNFPVDEDDRLFRPDFDPAATAAREILETVIASEGAERSATERIRDAQTEAESLATLVPQYGHALEQATREHYTAHLTTALGPEGAAMINNDGLSAVTTALLAAETSGWKPSDIITLAAADRPLELADSPAALLAWRIRHIADHRPASLPIAQPTAADARRYARTLARIYPHLKPDPESALTPPPLRVPGDQHPGPTVSAKQVHAWANAVAEHLGVDVADIETHRAWPQLTTTLVGHHAAGNDVHQLIPTATRTPNTDLTTVARTARRLSAPTSMRMPAAIRYHQAADNTLGPDLAYRARTSSAWPTIVTALVRAEQLGCEPETALHCAISQREFRGARDISQLLAWRIGRQNRIAHTDPTLTPAILWRSLALSLKAAEITGANPARLLRAAASDSANFTDFVAHVHDNSRRLHHTHQPPSPVNLPWLHIPTGLLDSPAINEQYRTYLHDLGTQINHRVTELAARAQHERPDWLNATETQPRQPKQRRAWNEAVAVIAAYRDQHRITTDDPQHPLGAYPTSGHAGHHPYWHAATALLAAQTTNPTPPIRQTTATGLSHDVEDQLLADTTTAIYTHLPTDE